MSKSTYLSLLLAGAVMGCSEEVASEKEPTNRAYLVSATPMDTIPLQNLKGMAQLSGQKSVVDLVRHGVATYKVVYNTPYKGTSIQASGLLYVPVGLQQPAPLISLQHGTTFVKKNAPSENGSFSGIEYFAAAGYIAFMPDFIGYGASSEIFHPYYDQKHSASSVIDGIKSVREFLEEKLIEYNDQLFLAGYSEGGYVTLAAAKELEANPTHGLPLTAVAAGAGGYDMEEMLRSVTGGRYYAYPAYLAFVLMAYNETNDWNKSLDYFFHEKYANALPALMAGESDGWQINSRLTSEVSKLLDPRFYAALSNPGGETELKKALKENSVSGWKTSLPIRLYHGTRDEIIPAHNSEVTLANFQELGSENVSLTLIPGGTHGSSFLPMLQQFIPWFETFRKK